MQILPPALTKLHAACVLMFAALCLTACASGPPQDGPRGDWGRAPRPSPPGEGEAGGPPRQARPGLFISPAGEPFRVQAGGPYPVAAWFAGADADHDGALTRDEFVADALRFFDRLDGDHNGVIDGFEVSAYETQVAPEILQGFQGGEGPGARGGGPRGKGGFGGGRRGGGGSMGGILQGATPYSLLAEPQPVMASDGDFDRRVTRAEATKAAKARFTLLDTDGDGRLRQATLPQTPMQARLEGPRASPPTRR